MWKELRRYWSPLSVILGTIYVTPLAGPKFSHISSRVNVLHSHTSISLVRTLSLPVWFFRHMLLRDVAPCLRHSSSFQHPTFRSCRTFFRTDGSSSRLWPFRITRLTFLIDVPQFETVNTWNLGTVIMILVVTHTRARTVICRYMDDSLYMYAW